MAFPIDLGFSLVDRYIVTALGKIKKQFLSDWEVFKKMQFFFSLRNYPVGPSHLPGERDVLFWSFASSEFSSSASENKEMMVFRRVQVFVPHCF